MEVSEENLVRCIKRLKKYDDRYYNSASPLVEDKEYDRFRDEVHKVAKKAKNKEALAYFKTVRAPVRESKRTENLPIVLGSLKKAKNDSNAMYNFVASVLKASKALSGTMTDSNIRKHYKKLVSYVISPKLDGLTFLLHYEYGELVAAYSGGDGIRGQLKTLHAKMLIEKGLIPEKISHENPRYVVGEIVCSKKKFQDVVTAQKKKDGTSNYNEVRNAASGWVNADKPSKDLLAAISFVAYEIKTPDGDLGVTRNLKKLDFGAALKANKLNTISTLKKWGFETYAGSKFMHVVSAVDFDDAFRNILDSMLDKVDSYEYPLDGIVVEVSDSHLRAAMGTARNGTPKYAVAYKVSADAAVKAGKGNTTRVTKIGVTTSKIGALKPTLHYDPIKIGNATYKKATGNNFSYLLKHGIGVGTQIAIVKAGDVIPKAYFADTNKAKAKDIFPKKCKCGAKAVEVHDANGKMLTDLYCELGATCVEAKREQLKFAIKATQVIGLGKKNIAKLFDAGHTDILSLAEAAIDKKEAKKLLKIEGFGESMLSTLSIGLPSKLTYMKFADLMVMSNVFNRPGLSLARAAFSDHEPALKSATKEKTISKSDCIKMLGKEKGKLLHQNFPEWLRFYKRYKKITELS